MNSNATGAAPTMSASEVLDAYFLETRAMLLEIAANLDRLERCADAGALAEDARIRFIHSALAVLQSNSGHRAEQIQRLYSKE